MRKLAFLILMTMAVNSSAQSDNYLNFRNNFPSNQEAAKNTHIYCENVKLSYRDALLIQSTGGANSVNETTLRNEDSYVNKHIYDSDIEMKFVFEKGAASEAAVGMAFETYPGGRVITYRFLVSANGHFYSHVDSASYSDYKRDLRQFTAKAVTPRLLIDGSENKLAIHRHHNYWSILINDQLVDSVRDAHNFPFNPANGIKFLFSGKFTIQLSSLNEDYALFQDKTSIYLRKLKQIEGSGYKIEDLNTTSNVVMDNNASVTFEMASGDVQATISSPAFGGDVKIRMARNSDGTYEKNQIPARLGEYEIVEFTLAPETKNWYLKAEKKSGDYEVIENDFYKTERSTTVTSTLWYRGTKR